MIAGRMRATLLEERQRKKEEKNWPAPAFSIAAGPMEEKKTEQKAPPFVCVAPLPWPSTNIRPKTAHKLLHHDWSEEIEGQKVVEEGFQIARQFPLFFRSLALSKERA